MHTIQTAYGAEEENEIKANARDVQKDFLPICKDWHYPISLISVLESRSNEIRQKSMWRLTKSPVGWEWKGMGATRLLPNRGVAVTQLDTTGTCLSLDVTL